MKALLFLETQNNLPSDTVLHSWYCCDSLTCCIQNIALQHSVDTEREDSDSGKDAAMGLLWDIAPTKEHGAEDQGVSVDR